MIDWPSFFKALKKPISSSIKEKTNKIGVRLARLNKWGQAPFFQERGRSQLVDRTAKNGACPLFPLQI